MHRAFTRLAGGGRGGGWGPQGGERARGGGVEIKDDGREKARQFQRSDDGVVLKEVGREGAGRQSGRILSEGSLTHVF